jgi:cytoskeleton protein RodZ
MRARIDVSEIEAQTKIRAKYLRALENEEWGLLPGPTFVKSFLRTYAQALGLDGKALVEEYRLHHEHPSEAMLEPIVSTPQSRRAPARTGRSGRTAPDSGPSRAYVVTVGVIGVIIVALIVLLITGGKSSNKPAGSSSTATTHSAASRSKHHAGTATHHRVASASTLVALSLKSTGAVYVCLVGDDGHKLIPGVDLQPGESTPTYHAKRFEITLGNSSVKMYVDGTPRVVAPSSQAIGYSITKSYGRRPLTAGRMPSCT